MFFRKWLIRVLVLGVVGAFVAGGVVYQRWTDPETVRQQVVELLGAQFPGAAVTLDSARLRLLGGTVLNELRLVRRDDPTKSDLVHIPSAIVYHDKEHLLDGKIVLRKVELHRPRLTLVRDGNGQWNLDGLIGEAVERGAPLPTLVIQQGTIVLIDHVMMRGVTPLELHDVNLTVVNDPPTMIVAEGTAASEFAGALKIRGSWKRDSRHAQLALEAPSVPVTAALIQRLAAYCPDPSLQAVQLEGRAELRAELGYAPSSNRPFRYDVRCRFSQGKLQHPRIPVPLENLEATLRCADGQVTCEKLTAQAGSGHVELQRGTALLPHPEQDFEAKLIVKHLALTKELFARLPDNVRKPLYDSFQPRGSATVKFECVRRAGQWLQNVCVIQPENISVCFERFPYPVDRLSGVVEYDFLEELFKIHVIAYSAKQPIVLKGTWKGAGIDADVKLDLSATGVSIDDKLIAALPVQLQKLARSFHATGRGHGTAHIRHTPGTKEFQNTFHAQFFDTTVRWDEFPYPLEKVSGYLDIYPHHWEFRDFRGTRNGGEIAVHGRTFPKSPHQPPGTDGRLVIDIVGRQVAIDKDLRTALQSMPGLAKAWDTFAPAGRMSFSTRIDQVPGQAQDLDITVDVRGCAIEPKFFPYLLHDLSGQFRFHRNRVDLVHLTAKHNKSQFSLEQGVIELHPNGGFYADLKQLQGNPIHPDDALMNALPANIKAACQTLQVRDPFALKTRVIVHQDGEPTSLPDIYWDGQAWTRDAKLNIGIEVDKLTGTLACQGRYDGRQMLGLNGNVFLNDANIFNQPLQGVHCKLQVKKETPDVLLIGLTKAPIFGGDISGQARVEFSSTLRYELNLTASQIQLDQFGRHNLGPGTQLSGIASARLHLTGHGTGVNSLEGNGRVDVPYSSMTKLYNLPLLLDLLKFLGLRWPDRTMFEEAVALFNIHGNRVSLSRLDLSGNVISLSGKGDVNLDGTDLQLDFYPSWARLEQILPPGIRSIPPAISKNLLKIEMRGKIGNQPGDFTFTKMPIPGIIEPIIQLRDRMTGKKNEK
jgi:hypothetical protein